MDPVEQILTRYRTDNLSNFELHDLFIDQLTGPTSIDDLIPRLPQKYREIFLRYLLRQRGIIDQIVESVTDPELALRWRWIGAWLDQNPTLEVSLPPYQGWLDRLEDDVHALLDALPREEKSRCRAFLQRQQSVLDVLMERMPEKERQWRAIRAWLEGSEPSSAPP